MDAVILAAGLGTRLRPHTLTKPKPLLPIRGRPILDWTLGALPRDVKRVIVVVHYLADQVEAYLHDRSSRSRAEGGNEDREWVTVVQHQPRGTGDAVRCCREHLESDRVLVLNGDDLYGAADLARLAGCAAGLLAYPVDEPRRFGIVFLRPDGKFDRLVEKPDLDGRRLANTGAYLFPRDILDVQLALSARGEYEITDYVNLVAARQPLEVVEAHFWLPIGTVEVWQQAQTMDLETVLTPLTPAPLPRSGGEGQG